MARSIASILLGIVVTFALIWFMAYLISGGAKRFNPSADAPVIDISMDKQETPPQNKTRELPKKPPPPKEPPKPMKAIPDDTPKAQTPMENLNLPKLDFSSRGGGPAIGGAPSIGGPVGGDGEATPIFRMDPKYPVEAARDGREGWVKLSFTINEVGGVEDIEVIDAEPKRIFDREAKRALAKWKYKPKIVDGKPVKQPGLTVQLDFKLEGKK
ncbi:TonB family protein [Gallaecimonas kandeliae]|uniref:energy transducer TonB n=1 Tax=Gallaecimonas kandeliae TaxID=3029055 RepID=UPI00264939CD|nr:energy transducer TonB [Gallaecimonas kandeliae]WKE64448.1 TonB family protein [Gallaecimonas kandeliae]